MNEIPVFFDGRMSCSEKLPSPSARKPPLALERWRADGARMSIKSFLPASAEDFKTVHDASHVDAILDLRRRNGFGTLGAGARDSLAWTTGSFMAAAKSAALSGLAACSPTSGFHHACWDSAHGYCTFNGLMCAAAALRLDGLDGQIAILDCDQHYGDGTEDILSRGLVDGVIHATAETGYPMQGEAFLEALPNILESMSGASVMFYQAGADCHVDDPLGGFLTSAQMRERDRLVFEFCATRKIGIAWNLAGGYQEEQLASGERNIRRVLDLHAQTMEECAKAFLSPSVGHAVQNRP